MTFDFEVDADALRASASALADTAADVAAGSIPPPAVPAPRWETSIAAESLADAFQRALARQSGDLDAFQQAVLAAIADYRAADDRAAGRLRANQ
jgi:hypothetical protein